MYNILLSDLMSPKKRETIILDIKRMQKLLGIASGMEFKVMNNIGEYGDWIHNKEVKLSERRGLTLKGVIEGFKGNVRVVPNMRCTFKNCHIETLEVPVTFVNNINYLRVFECNVEKLISYIALENLFASQIKEFELKTPELNRFAFIREDAIADAVVDNKCKIGIIKVDKPLITGMTTLSDELKRLFTEMGITLGKEMMLTIEGTGKMNLNVLFGYSKFIENIECHPEILREVSRLTEKKFNFYGVKVKYVSK